MRELCVFLGRCVSSIFYDEIAAERERERKRKVELARSVGESSLRQKKRTFASSDGVARRERERERERQSAHFASLL
jgi:hypothetical protein